LNTVSGRLPEVREVKMPHGEASIYVATVLGPAREHVCKLDFGYGKASDVSTARLIAAAPELLAALKKAQIDVCSEYCGESHHVESCRDATTAIAKAEGRA